MYNSLNTLADLLVVIHLFGILVYIFVNYKSKVLDYFFSLLLAVAISEGIKFFIDKPRPVLELEGGSFPSTHVTVAVNAFCFLLLACHTLSKNQNREGRWMWFFVFVESMTKKQFMTIAFISAITIGVLRIATGAHYFIDIMAGGVVGLVASTLFRYYDVSARRLK